MQYHALIYNTMTLPSGYDLAISVLLQVAFRGGNAVGTQGYLLYVLLK